MIYLLAPETLSPADSEALIAALTGTTNRRHFARIAPFGRHSQPTATSDMTECVETAAHGWLTIAWHEKPSARLCSLLGYPLTADDLADLSDAELATAGLQVCPDCGDPEPGTRWVALSVPWEDEARPCSTCGNGYECGCGVVDNECQCGALIRDCHPICPDCSADMAERVEAIESCKD